MSVRNQRRPLKRLNNPLKANKKNDRIVNYVKYFDYPIEQLLVDQSTDPLQNTVRQYSTISGKSSTDYGEGRFANLELTVRGSNGRTSILRPCRDPVLRRGFAPINLISPFLPPMEFPRIVSDQSIEIQNERYEESRDRQFYETVYYPEPIPLMSIQFDRRDFSSNPFVNERPFYQHESFDQPMFTSENHMSINMNQNFMYDDRHHYYSDQMGNYENSFSSCETKQSTHYFF